MRKVCVAITARPSYSRIKSALEAIRTSPDLDLHLLGKHGVLIAADALGIGIGIGIAGGVGGV